MNLLLLSVNSKYIHTLLSAWYLKSSVAHLDVKTTILETSINSSLWKTLFSIAEAEPSIIGISTYIYNIEFLKLLLPELKKINPQIIIIIGGPEATANPYPLLDYADYIIKGEGEISFPTLISEIIAGKTPSHNKIIEGIPYKNLDKIPSPYNSDILKESKGKIIYYEANRGCPFSCSYCISGEQNMLRAKSIEIIEKELKILITEGVKLIKFVDRTFNSHRKNAIQIIELIIKEFSLSEATFHFEVAGDLFNEELFNVLEKAPTGMFQMEIGVQSFNEETLIAVARKTSIAKVSESIKRILSLETIHLHADLIVGLPLEDFHTFKKSFNDLYSLSVHHLQIGFLKLLHGTPIRENASKYEYLFTEFAPYEIISNKFISALEIFELKIFEMAFERYYNSRYFVRTLEHFVSKALDNNETAFDFFYGLAKELKNSGIMSRSISKSELYNILSNYLILTRKEKENIVCELLKFDFFISDSSYSPPSCITEFKPRNQLYKWQRGKESTTVSFSINPITLIAQKKHLSTKEEILLTFNYIYKSPVTERFSYKEIYF